MLKGHRHTRLWEWSLFLIMSDRFPLASIGSPHSRYRVSTLFPTASLPISCIGHPSWFRSGWIPPTHRRGCQRNVSYPTWVKGPPATLPSCPRVCIGHPFEFPIGWIPADCLGGVTENVGHLRQQPVSGVHHEP